jgi:hypothetical protein
MERRKLGERENGIGYCCESMNERMNYDAWLRLLKLRGISE